jgi:hypothetical protein
MLSSSSDDIPVGDDNRSRPGRLISDNENNMEVLMLDGAAGVDREQPNALSLERWWSLMNSSTIVDATAA